MSTIVYVEKTVPYCKVRLSDVIEVLDTTYVVMERHTSERDVTRLDLWTMPNDSAPHTTLLVSPANSTATVYRPTVRRWFHRK